MHSIDVPKSRERLNATLANVAHKLSHGFVESSCHISFYSYLPSPQQFETYAVMHKKSKRTGSCHGQLLASSVQRKMKTFPPTAQLEDNQTCNLYHAAAVDATQPKANFTHSLLRNGEERRERRKD